jgi:NADH dehydrogenase
MTATTPRIVVVGGGFGGLRVVRGLARAPVQITLIDRRNFHLFQPLSYQVATGALAPGDITYPLRGLFAGQDNVSVVLGEVARVDVERRLVHLSFDATGTDPEPIAYDRLIVACGSSYSYFGHDEWAGVAHEVKSLESALKVRSSLLSAFEAAELTHDDAQRRAAMTFVVVGGGPTGVEIAGQIGELARDTLKRDFRHIDPRDARILLVEGEERLLTAFPASLSARAEEALSALGVTTVLGRLVVDIADHVVTLKARDGTTETIEAETVVWAAGVRASGLGSALAAQVGASTDHAGRLDVGPDLTLPGHPEITALGDMVRVGEKVYPGVAPVAIQQGTYVAKRIRDELAGQPHKPFRYRDKGNLATIGRGRAVADFGNGKLKVWGLPAWLLWVGVHLWYLVGFENRAVVFLRWAISFVTRGRGSRIISATQDPGQPRA